MPLKQHPTNPDMVIYKKTEYGNISVGKEWVGLTDDEIKDAWSQLWYDLNNGKFAASDDPSRHTNIMFARALEAKLKEKNA